MKNLSTRPVENDQEVQNLQSELDFVAMARNGGRLKLRAFGRGGVGGVRRTRLWEILGDEGWTFGSGEVN